VGARQRAIDLPSPSFAKQWSDQTHEMRGPSAFDRRGHAGLPLLGARWMLMDSSLDQDRNVFDDVLVGHLHPNERDRRRRWRAREERALTL